MHSERGGWDMVELWNAARHSQVIVFHWAYSFRGSVQASVSGFRLRGCD